MVRPGMPMRQRQARGFGVYFIVAALASAFLPANANEWKGKEYTIDGERHINNPSEPIEAGRTQETAEKWRRGGERDDAVFGKIKEIVLDKSGVSYLLDGQVGTVHVMSPDGDYIRSNWPCRRRTG